MNYVTTNIRIPEEDYLRLKAEAAKRRKSLSSVIRAKISIKKKIRSKAEAAIVMQDIDKVAKEIAKYLPKDFDSVKALREIRYQDQ